MLSFNKAKWDALGIALDDFIAHINESPEEPEEAAPAHKYKVGDVVTSVYTGDHKRYTITETFFHNGPAYRVTNDVTETEGVCAEKEINGLAEPEKPVFKLGDNVRLTGASGIYVISDNSATTCSYYVRSLVGYDMILAHVSALKHA